MNDLGSFLALARANKQVSLREVEELTGVSNAYISQLEKGKVRSPSPVVLHKLSVFYRVSYPRVLELAGYPVPNGNTSQSNSSFESRIGPITEEEEEELVEYLKFLRSKRKKKNG